MTSVEAKPFHKMTVVELRDELSSRGIDFEDRSKDEMIIDLYEYEISSKNLGIDSGTDEIHLSPKPSHVESFGSLEQSKMYYQFMTEQKVQEMEEN